MKRLFFALRPDDETRHSIDQLNRSIHARGMKKVKPDNLHVTLVFLGNVNAEAEEKIKEDAQSINGQPFVLHFDQLDYWRKPRILCLTSNQYDLELLRLVESLQAVVAPLGFKPEERPYKPHITLARKAVATVDCDFKSIAWRAQSFSLVESRSSFDGVDYQALQSWSFD